MLGETVVIRAFAGLAVTARVWDADGEAVYVLADKEFSQLQSGDGPLPAGFRREDVFEYRDELKPIIASGQLDWSSLDPWDG